MAARAMKPLPLSKRPLADQQITIPGPQGLLAGAYMQVTGATTAVVIVPGSGPTDRDGNGPNGLNSNSYLYLARAFAEMGLSSLRIDKRGMFGSHQAINDANDVVLQDYASDVQRWCRHLLHEYDITHIVLAGHSEGGLVALKAAADCPGLQGLMLMATPGRPAKDMLLAQLVQNAGLGKADTDSVADFLEALKRDGNADTHMLPRGVQDLFPPAIHGYLVDLLNADPVSLADRLDCPVLVMQGLEDIQVTEEDAGILYHAISGAKIVLCPNATHMMKAAVPDAPLATYCDPALALDPAWVEGLRQFCGKL